MVARHEGRRLVPCTVAATCTAVIASRADPDLERGCGLALRSRPHTSNAAVVRSLPRCFFSLPVIVTAMTHFRIVTTLRGASLVRR
jgi:hypothetical protein